MRQRKIFLKKISTKLQTNNLTFIEHSFVDYLLIKIKGQKTYNVANLVKIIKKINIIKHFLIKSLVSTMNKIDIIIKKALKEKIFSACALGYFFMKDGNVHKKIHTFGRIGPGRKDFLLDEKSFFDLASLTKPMVTAFCILILLNSGKINLEDRLDKFFNEISVEKKHIKIKHLLNHSSGFPAHKEYFLPLKNFLPIERRKRIIKEILKEELFCYPGEEYIYSDLGYMLLGRIIEIVSGESLEDFWKRNVVIPMHLENHFIFKRETRWKKHTIVKTDRNQWNQYNKKCIVNDKNCKLFGGVAGHAGLFGTIYGVLLFTQKIFFELTKKQGTFNFSNEIRENFFRKENCESWVYGFDTPSSGYSSSGNFFSNLSYGHLGFTGTSFWIDLKQECGVVLLTNRVLFENSLKEIRKIRPEIHDAVMQLITRMKGFE